MSVQTIVDAVMDAPLSSITREAVQTQVNKRGTTGSYRGELTQKLKALSTAISGLSGGKTRKSRSGRRHTSRRRL